MSFAIEVVLVDNARGDGLVMLAEEVQEAVGRGGKNMDNGIGIGGREITDMVGNLLGQRGGMTTTGDALLARPGRQRE